MNEKAWTAQQIVGHNVKTRREAHQMTAKSMGIAMGEVFGKTWPPQTVYMMEAGERKMVAAEVVALAHILETTVADLFSPPSVVETVEVGTLRVPAEALMEPIGDDADLEALARDLRALDRARVTIGGALDAQWIILDRARTSLRGETEPEPPQGDNPWEIAVRGQMEAADAYYEDKGPLRFGPMGEDDGEDQ